MAADVVEDQKLMDVTDSATPLERSAKSPPRLQVPAAPAAELVDDRYLFSPGVDTPGHKLDAIVSGGTAHAYRMLACARQGGRCSHSRERWREQQLGLGLRIRLRPSLDPSA